MITKKGIESLVTLIVLKAKKLTPVIFIDLLSSFPLTYCSKVVGGKTVGVIVLSDFSMYSGLVCFRLIWLSMILLRKLFLTGCSTSPITLELFWNYAAILELFLESDMYLGLSLISL